MRVMNAISVTYLLAGIRNRIGLPEVPEVRSSTWFISGASSEMNLSKLARTVSLSMKPKILRKSSAELIMAFPYNSR